MRRYLTITQEATFGTYNGAGTAINIRLSSSGAFRPMQSPDFWTIPDGSGLGVQVLCGTNTASLTGSLTTELTYAQASFLLGWAMSRINSGQTTPWTTTELPNDLPSCTIDYARQFFDTTGYDVTRYAGCKVSSLSLSGAKDSPKIMASIGLIGSSFSGHGYSDTATINNPAASLPALTTYPTDVAVFQHLKGGLTLNNVSRSNFDSWTLSLSNKLNPYWDESHFANAIRLGGRSLTAQIRFRKKSTANDYTLWYPPTALGTTTAFVLTNGTNTITIGMNAKSYVANLSEDSPLDAEHYYALTLMNQLDASAGSDFTFTYS